MAEDNKKNNRDIECVYKLKIGYNVYPGGYCTIVQITCKKGAFDFVFKNWLNENFEGNKPNHIDTSNAANPLQHV